MGRAKRLISKTEFAGIAGVSQAAITKASRKQIRKAMTRDGRVNLDHAAVKTYLASRGLDVPPRADEAPTDVPEEDAAADAAPTQEEVRNLQDIGFYAELPHRRVVTLFGTGRGMRDWLEALKALDALREKRMRMDVARGALIDRKMVETHVFGTLDACNRQLLHDAAPAIVDALLDHAAAGGTREEGEQLVCDIVSAQLRLAYNRVRRMLTDECKASQPAFTDEADGRRAG